VVGAGSARNRAFGDVGDFPEAMRIAAGGDDGVAKRLNSGCVWVDREGEFRIARVDAARRLGVYRCANSGCEELLRNAECLQGFRSDNDGNFALFPSAKGDAVDFRKVFEALFESLGEILKRGFGVGDEREAPDGLVFEIEFRDDGRGCIFGKIRYGVDGALNILLGPVGIDIVAVVDRVSRA